MAPPKKNGCIDWSEMIADGENPKGIVNVNVNGDQIGTRPQDLIGRQGYAWGGSRDGEFGPYGPDHFLSESEKAAMFGPMPAIAGSKKKR